MRRARLEAAQLGHDAHDGRVVRVALQALAVAARVVHRGAHARQRRVALEVPVLVQLVDGLRGFLGFRGFKNPKIRTLNPKTQKPRRAGSPRPRAAH